MWALFFFKSCFLTHILPNSSQNEVTVQMSPTTIFLVSIQQGYHHAKELYKQKQVCQNPRASVQWSLAKEDNFQQILERARNGMVYWIGTENKNNES